MSATSQKPKSIPVSSLDKGHRFPTTAADRAYFMKSVKKVTPFQWACYDLLCKIPDGTVTTYAAIAKTLNSSPRAVGSAMRSNPFAPAVPCHRVIAANGTVGGYGGHKNPGPMLQQKINMLKAEGVLFTSDGKLKNPSKALWQP